jgi:hypothetical protein
VLPIDVFLIVCLVEGIVFVRNIDSRVNPISGYPGSEDGGTFNVVLPLLASFLE